MPTFDPSALELAADALRAAAVRHRRAAETYSGEIRTARAAGEIKDARTPALKVLDLLGQAATLEDIAGCLTLLVDLAEPLSPAPDVVGNHGEDLDDLDPDTEDDDQDLDDDEEDPELLRRARAELEAIDDPIAAALA